MLEPYYQILRSDFASFIGKTLTTVNPGADYLPNWHIDLIAEYLEAARRREIRRLIINMPPRALKSTCVSVAWPAWLLGGDPAVRTIVASYASSLATKHTAECRFVMKSGWYRNIFPPGACAIASDQNEKDKFVMRRKRGFYMATSVGSGVTGEGADFLIVDDPQTPMQAMSAGSRDMVNTWFDQTFSTRLNDKKKGVIVLVMQRLHEHDLAGHLLKKGGWTHLCLPAIAEETQHYNVGQFKKTREAGEALHAAREDHELVERAKAELGSAAFAAQYQQQPLPESGGMVRPWWFGRYSELPPCGRFIQSWDTAIKSGPEHDASVCLTFGEIEGKSFLCDACVMKLEYPELKRAFHDMAEQWRPQAILLEDKASGQQLLQDMKREALLPVIGMKPQGDKVMRFAAVSAMIEAGKVMLPLQASWLPDFEREVFSFPASGRDDQVDALTQYLDWVRNNAFKTVSLRRL